MPKDGKMGAGRIVGKGGENSMSEEVYGVLLRDSGRKYLVAVEETQEEAQETAEQFDEEAWENALVLYNEGEEVGSELEREDFDGLHFAEPITRELAERCAPQLQRNIAVQLS